MRYTAITRNSDFARVYKRGKNFVHPYVVLYVYKNRVGSTRVGITASKKVGNAVKRNRARRVILNALFKVLPENAGAYDFVFVARGQTTKIKSSILVPVLKKMFAKAEIRL